MSSESKQLLVSLSCTSRSVIHPSEALFAGQYWGGLRTKNHGWFLLNRAHLVLHLEEQGCLQRLPALEPKRGYNLLICKTFPGIENELFTAFHVSLLDSSASRVTHPIILSLWNSNWEGVWVLVSGCIYYYSHLVALSRSILLSIGWQTHMHTKAKQLRQNEEDTSRRAQFLGGLWKMLTQTGAVLSFLEQTCVYFQCPGIGWLLCVPGFGPLVVFWFGTTTFSVILERSLMSEEVSSRFLCPYRSLLHREFSFPSVRGTSKLQRDHNPCVAPAFEAF